MYNEYRRPASLKALRDSFALKVNDTEYAAFIYTSSFLFDATYKDLKERLAQFTPEVQSSYFGQILDRQLSVLKNIEVGLSPAEFTVTDKEDGKVSLSDIAEGLYFAGVPILMLVSPEGTTLARGYTEAYAEVKDILDKELGGR